MSYTNADGRTQLLSEVERAATLISGALSSLGEAYEWLDEQSAERLEQELFRPAQAALGRVRRTYDQFATAHGLPPSSLCDSLPTGRPGDARGAIERAVQDAQAADTVLSTLQDSMLPVEVGDPAVRAGLAAVRESLSPVPSRARELLRVLGR